jgi:hypothetical protein
MSHVGETRTRARRRQGAGLNTSFQVWRIEKFQVLAAPTEFYGPRLFYGGHSVACLVFTRPINVIANFDPDFYLGISKKDAEFSLS